MGRHAIPIDGRNDDSFDPRSWNRKRPRAPSPADKDPGTPVPPDATVSFDPATWVPEAHSLRSSESASKPKSEARARRATRPAVVSVAVLVLLLTGGTAAYLSRPDPAARRPQTGPVVLAETPKHPLHRPPSPQPQPQPGHSLRTVTIAGPDRVSAAIGDLGLDSGQVSELTNAVLQHVGRRPGELRLGADLARSAGGQLSLSWLEVNRTDGSGVRLVAAGDGFKPEKIASRLITRIIAVRGEMGTTFYSSAVEAGVDDSLISDFANAFIYDVDFQFELHPGDIFEGAYDQDVNPWGEAVGGPRLLFVSLRLRDKSLRFYRFKSGGEYGWFNVSGRSNLRSLMRTPVDGARVTSGFGMRFHPILRYTRLHGGTDFAAPTGTPVYASGTGKVIVASCCRGGAGTMVALQHDSGWITHYFHLSKIMPGIVPGKRVTQGDKIALVGTTGGSTGPHLHYEIVINGKKVDPLKVDTGQGKTLTGAEMAAFRRQRDRVDAARAAGEY